jgi:hypothetical protein
MMRPLRSVLTVALTALACLTLAPTSHGATARACGLTARIDGVRYDVREVRGAISCRTVKRVVTSFLRHGTVDAPWTCARGHGSSPYAASCGRGARVLVRVYAPT